MSKQSLCFIFLSCLIYVTACNNTKKESSANTKNVVDTTSISSVKPLSKNNNQVNDTSSKVIAKSKSQLLKFINDFSEKDFNETRKELVATSKEQQYQISDIIENDGILKYSVTIPGIDIKGEYTCNPKKGDLTIIWAGDKDVTQVYFQQAKVGLHNKSCNTTDFAEQCDSFEDWNEYPLKTHFTISLLNQQGISIYTFHRQIIPKQ